MSHQPNPPTEPMPNHEQVLASFIAVVLENLRARFRRHEWTLTGRTIILGLSPADTSYSDARHNHVFLRFAPAPIPMLATPRRLTGGSSPLPEPVIMVTLMTDDNEDVTQLTDLTKPHTVGDMIVQKVENVRSRAQRLARFVSSFGVSIEHCNGDASPIDNIS